MASQLLVLLVASCCVCVSLGESHLLTVVGEVGESSARLLLDHATTVHRPESDWLLRHLPRHLATTLTSLPVNVTISLAVASQSFLCEAHLGRLRRRGLADVGSKLAEAHGCWSRLTEASFAATTLPLAFSLEGLPPGRSILATVRTEHGVVDHALWRTFPASPPPHAGTEHKIIAVSCDRYLQDGDDDMVVRLVRDEWDRDLSVHMGDQIYADALVRAWKLVLEEHGGGARGQEALDALFRAVGADTVRLTLLETFRTLYRINWGRDAMRAFLRIGGHLMILDDHEVVNNADEESMSAPEWVPFVLAGGTAFLEFQHQLSGPKVSGNDSMAPSISAQSQAGPASTVSAHSARVLAGVGVLLMDSRFARTFHGAGSASTFLGDPQWLDISRTLRQWEASGDVTDIIVFSATPLMSMSTSKARIVDAAEKERYLTHPRHAASLARLMELLTACDKMRLVVGGDFHLALHIDYCSESTAACLPQLVASGLTIGSTALQEKKLFLFDWVATFLTRARFDAPGHEPWHMFLRSVALTRNYGVIYVGDASFLAQRAMRPTWVSNHTLWPDSMMWKTDSLRSSGSLAWRSVTLEPEGLMDSLLHHGFRSSRVLLRLFLFLFVFPRFARAAASSLRRLVKAS